MTERAGRSQYRRLMAQPAWLLYDGERLVASCRAETAIEARLVFRAGGMTGTHMRLASAQKGRP